MNKILSGMKAKSLFTIMTILILCSKGYAQFNEDDCDVEISADVTQVCGEDEQVIIEIVDFPIGYTNFNWWYSVGTAIYETNDKIIITGIPSGTTVVVCANSAGVIPTCDATASDCVIIANNEPQNGADIDVQIANCSSEVVLVAEPIDGTWTIDPAIDLDLLPDDNINDNVLTVGNILPGSYTFCWNGDVGTCASQECITVNYAPILAPSVGPTSVPCGATSVNIATNLHLLANGQNWNTTGSSGNLTFSQVASGGTVNVSGLALGSNTVVINTTYAGCQSQSTTITINVAACESEACENKLILTQGARYVVSAWVKEKDVVPLPISYENVKVSITFGGGGSTQMYDFSPSGAIIDGWQKIEEEFDVPAGAASFAMTLHNESNGTAMFFDDIRIHPFDASMKSFVYDPVTLRLIAELDERNYATYYEYDEEGALIRIKKETERGIMTIQEGRNAIRKKN